MGKTTIAWSDYSWSPLRVRVRHDAAQIAKAKGYGSLVQIAEKMAGHVGPHCERVSHGCDACYSDTNNGRCLPANGTGLPFDRRSRDLVEPFVDEKILMQPLHWRKPRRVFPENQSDLFGEWYTDEMIDRVFAVMALTPHITYQVLSKRPERMLSYCKSLGQHHTTDRVSRAMKQMSDKGSFYRLSDQGWCFSNIWMGVSAEDQRTWEERTAILEQVPAVLRWVSLEPQLAYVYVRPVLKRGKIGWLVIGGESGRQSRPFNIAWAHNTIDQCESVGVPCFVKQLGSNPRTNAINGYDDAMESIKLRDRKGGDPKEWPFALRVRQFPEVRA